jgi:hypothetical protein
MPTHRVSVRENSAAHLISSKFTVQAYPKGIILNDKYEVLFVDIFCHLIISISMPWSEWP